MSLYKDFFILYYNMIPKRLSRDKGYSRPETTYQQTLSNHDIKEKLKDYKKVENIKNVSIGTHCRYFTIDPKTKQKVFRLGGNLNKIDPEGRFVVLTNGQLSWSVQIPNSIFYQKMTEIEIKDEMKKELKKEIMTEQEQLSDDDDLKKQVKYLLKKMEDYKDLEKKNEQLTMQLKTIEKEIKKEKNKK
jgi:hypothetical protein